MELFAPVGPVVLLTYKGAVGAMGFHNRRGHLLYTGCRFHGCFGRSSYVRAVGLAGQGGKFQVQHRFFDLSPVLPCKRRRP